MIKVHIPAPLQSYTSGQALVEAEGNNVRQLIAALDESYPGLKPALMDGDKLKADVAVAIDGHVAQLGILQSLAEAKEVIFIPAIGGG